MKKTVITLSITFSITMSAFGQSLTLTPTTSNQVSVRTYATQKPIFSGYHSEGSASAPTSTLNGRILAGLYGYGYVVNTFRTDPNASIEFKAVNNFSNNNHGTEILFNTTRFNTTVSFEKMRITHDGYVGIGTSNPQSMLEVKTLTANYGLQHTDGTATVSTYLNSNGGWLGTRSNHHLNFFVNDGLEKLRIESGGNIIVSDYTKLGGTSAPAIKQKEITGYNTANSTGGSTPVPHGLTPNKIIDVAIFVEAVESGDVSQIPPRFPGGVGFSYSYIIKPTFIEVYLNDGANILNKPIRMLITYKE